MAFNAGLPPSVAKQRFNLPTGLRFFYLPPVTLVLLSSPGGKGAGLGLIICHPPSASFPNYYV